MCTKEVKISKFDDEDEELLKIYSPRPYARFNGTLLHEAFAAKLDEILNMDVKDDDIWVCSFPKSGTTWTQEMVWCVANDLDFNGAEALLSDRYMFLDLCFIMSPGRFPTSADGKRINALIKAKENIDEVHGPRFIKTHLPFDLLPRKLRDGSTKAKVVYVSRNPRDACISSFHHRKLMGTFEGDLETYCNLFLHDTVTFGPYWKHIFGFWSKRHLKNVLFIKFEDMKKDLPQIVEKVATFFDKKFDKDEINTLCEHLSFENMKNNPAVNADSLTETVRKINSTKGSGSFIRKGAVDQWKSDLSESTILRFEEWEKKNLKDTAVTSYYNF